MDFGTVFDVLFQSAIVLGVPLFFWVLSLVQWLKGALGLEGRPVQILSMVVGVTLGVGYQLSLGAVSGFSAWFATILFGLALGLSTSKAYEAGKQITGTTS